MAVNKAKKAAAAVKKLIDRERELAGLIKSLKEELDGIKGQMLETMIGGKIDRVETEDYQVIKVQGTHTRLSKEKLVEEGVSVDVIALATVKTSYNYIRVSERKEVRV